MTDKQIISITIGCSVLALAIAIPVILSRSPATDPAPVPAPVYPTPPVQSSDHGPGIKSAVSAKPSRDATPAEEDALSDLASIVEQRGAHLMQQSDLDSAARRRVYLAMYRAIGAAEVRGDSNYDYRPQIASQFDLTVEQVNAIAVEGLKKQWPTR